MTHTLSRRDFLRVAALSSAAVLLAACTQEINITPIIPDSANNSGNTNTSDRQPAATPLPPDKKPLQLMLRGGRNVITQATIDAWNSYSKTPLALVTGSGGGYGIGTVGSDMAALIQTNIASGNQPWDGYATITSPWDMTNWISREVIVPLDDLVKTSISPSAGQVLNSLVANVKGAISYQGKTYGIPANVGSVALEYFPLTLQNAGYTQVPQTWDDIYAAARLVKAKYTDSVPFRSSSSPLTDLWAMMWASMQQPLDKDGLMDIRSPEALDALTWLRQMVDEGLMATGPGRGGFGGGFGGGDNATTSTPAPVGVLPPGMTAISLAQDSFGSLARLTDSQNRAGVGSLPVPHVGIANAGSPYWVNLCTVLNKATNPQGMVDFYLWLFSPQNKDSGKQVAQNAAKPCYTYTYTDFIDNDANLAWERTSINLVGHSIPFPMDAYNAIEQSTASTHIQNVLDTKKQFTREMAGKEMQAAYDEIKAAISKLTPTSN